MEGHSLKVLGLDVKVPRGRAVLVAIDHWIGKIEKYLGNKSMDMSVRVCIDRGNRIGRAYENVQVALSVPWARLPRSVERRKKVEFLLLLPDWSWTTTSCLTLLPP